MHNITVRIHACVHAHVCPCVHAYVWVIAKQCHNSWPVWCLVCERHLHLLDCKLECCGSSADCACVYTSARMCAATSIPGQRIITAEAQAYTWNMRTLHSCTVCRKAWGSNEWHNNTVRIHSVAMYSQTRRKWLYRSKSVGGIECATSTGGHVVMPPMYT